MNPSLKGFRSHLDTEFEWSAWIHAARDGRGQQTCVSTGLILTCLSLQVLRGLTSCLKLDQHLRLPYFARALNHPRPQRGQGLFSDSTLFRCMQTLDVEWQRLFFTL